MTQPTKLMFAAVMIAALFLGACDPATTATAPLAPTQAVAVGQNPNDIPIVPVVAVPVGSEAKQIKTAEIVRLLETAEIESVSTKHSQVVYIKLKDGTTYKGTYVYEQAGKYAKIKECSDILNLVVHIQKARSKKEKIDWQIACE